MAQIINLNKFRKAKQRAQAKAKAAENRAKFGRTKAQKKKDQDDTQAAKDEHEGHRLEDPDEKH
jgi:hypothetical protein